MFNAGGTTPGPGNGGDNGGTGTPTPSYDLSVSVTRVGEGLMLMLVIILLSMSLLVAVQYLKLMSPLWLILLWRRLIRWPVCLLVVAGDWNAGYERWLA